MQFVYGTTLVYEFFPILHVIIDKFHWLLLLKQQVLVKFPVDLHISRICVLIIKLEK